MPELLCDAHSSFLLFKLSFFTSVTSGSVIALNFHLLVLMTEAASVNLSPLT
jgi:hypothetical protein